MRSTVRAALDELTLTLRDVAMRLRASYPAVRSWRAGSRTPGLAARRRLVRLLRAQARRLRRLADRLARADR
jgi:hypothetical protein